MSSVDREKSLQQDGDGVFCDSSPQVRASVIHAAGAGFLPANSRRQVSPHEAVLAPALYLRPELGEGAEFCAAANVDVDLFLERVGIVSGCANVFDVIPELFEAFTAVIEDDHAVAGVASWAPEKPGLMAAEGWGQAVGAAEEVDGTGLAVVLGEDAAVPTVVDGKVVPRYGGFGDDLLPSELVCVPLRQRGSGVIVFHYGQLHGEMLRVGEEAVGRKNRHGHGSEVCAEGEQGNYNRGFQPRATRGNVFRRVSFSSFDGGFNDDCACGQQHGIYRGEIVILSVKNEEDGEAGEVTPAEHPVRL